MTTLAKLLLLLSGAQLAVLVDAQGKTASVDPPPASRGLPADMIGTDVDLISYPDLNNTVCPELKALRQNCYDEAKAKQSFNYENQCLCSPDVAYAVARCASGQYAYLDNKQEKAAYYQDFLYYTYDCWCVAGKVDVTYNATAKPVVPFVKGWTGDAILPPPAGSCPTDQRDDNGKLPETGNSGTGGGSTTTTVVVYKNPVPPCNCKPPNPNPVPLPCPEGWTRCSGKCVPIPPRCATCNWPFIQDKEDCTKCVCPAPWVLTNGACKLPENNTCQTCCKDPNAILVRGCYKSYCKCKEGYQECAGKCVLACGKGENRQKDCTCRKPCTGGKVPDWKGVCACPQGQKENARGVCEQINTCRPNEKYDDYINACYCPRPDYVYDRAGNCEKVKCGAWDASCYPPLPEQYYSNATVEVIFSSAPPETTYTETILSDGATPTLVELATTADDILPTLPDTTLPAANATSDSGAAPTAEPTPTAAPTDMTELPTATPSEDTSMSDAPSSTSTTPDPYGAPTPTADAGSSGSSGDGTSSGSGSGSDSGAGGSGTDAGSGSSGSDAGGSSGGSGSEGGSGSGGDAPVDTPTARQKRRVHARHF